MFSSVKTILLSTQLSGLLCLALGAEYQSILSAPVEVDPCAAIANKTWVAPQDVRACFGSFPVKPEIKDNIIEVVNKTLAFHTSVNYQRLAPPPFDFDVHEDVIGDLARISSQNYSTDFDLHLDLSRSVKRLNDGHCVYINLCYDSLFLTYLPTPLILLTNATGDQNVHIAAEAFTVASAEFKEEIDVWQNALPGKLRGQLSTLSGAKVFLIDGKSPFDAVNQNALITGGYQSFGTRQNSYFSSYQVVSSGWNYFMGNFAQMSLPLADSVELTIQRANSTDIETITLPYRSRISPFASSWNDSTTFFENNCVAGLGTNGHDLYTTAPDLSNAGAPRPISIFQQQPRLHPSDARKHRQNVILDTMPQQNIELPPTLIPQSPLNESWSVAQFFMLNDNRTGVLALGSFAASSFDDFQRSLLDGLTNLTSKGADRLIVDVTNNGGGFICIAHWLHRIIAGPKNSTEPQAGLDTTTRAGPLAQLIVKEIEKGGDPDKQLLYNPTNWAYANHTKFPETLDWMQPVVKKIINGQSDAFSQRLGNECQPFQIEPPAERLFDPKKTIIISNGRCASSCSLFSITMSKEEGATTVVVGGKADVPQQYCGIVGGQSTDFSTMDTEIKSVNLKNHSLAPPDFKTNSIQGITWRLGFGIDDPSEPEEWQDHPADLNLRLTEDINSRWQIAANNPAAIWERVVEYVFGD